VPRAARPSSYVDWAFREWVDSRTAVKRSRPVQARAALTWKGPAGAGPFCSRSVSGILSWAAIHLGLLSPAGSLPPTWSSAGRVIAPIGVAPGGACLAAPVSGDAGGLLHHRFTLTATFTCDAAAVSSLLRFPAGFPVRALPGTLALRCPDFPRRLRAAAARSALPVYPTLVSGTTKITPPAAW